jgi:hypothetical protein
MSYAFNRSVHRLILNESKQFVVVVVVVVAVAEYLQPPLVIPAQHQILKFLFWVASVPTLQSLPSAYSWSTHKLQS